MKDILEGFDKEFLNSNSIPTRAISSIFTKEIEGIFAFSATIGLSVDWYDRTHHHTFWLSDDEDNFQKFVTFSWKPKGQF